jgi:hypothetical protein
VTIAQVNTAPAGSPDIIPDHHSAYPAQPAGRTTPDRRQRQLCQALNTTDNVYPGAMLTLRYSVNPPGTAHHYRAMSGVLPMPGESRI